MSTSTPYDDIIHLPHPVSTTHPHMSMLRRAAQFAPFAALSGHHDAIRATAERREQEELFGIDELEMDDSFFI